MKRTAKLNAALKQINALNLPTASEQATNYNNLERAGWYWNSKEGIWENLKRSNSMFKNDDGEPTGVIRLRLMAHPGDIDQFMEIVSEALDSYGITVVDESNLYPNRRGSGVRVYITATLPKEVKKKQAKARKSKRSPAQPEEDLTWLVD